MTPQQIIEKLKEARSLIESPDHFITGVMAADELGNVVKLGNPNAKRFCVTGAVYKVCGGEEDENGWRHDYKQPSDLLSVIQALTETAGVDPSVVNNVDGHSATLKMVDDTIARLSKETVAA